MSNITKWQVWTWDYSQSRYVKEYVTEFDDTWRAPGILEEVVKHDRNLPDGMTPFGTRETIVSKVVREMR